MTDSERALVKQEWEVLLRECEGRRDAMQYVEDIASDLGLDVEEVIEYIKAL